MLSLHVSTRKKTYPTRHGTYKKLSIEFEEIIQESDKNKNKKMEKK